jgi:hypothetical protein
MPRLVSPICCKIFYMVSFLFDCSGTSGCCVYDEVTIRSPHHSLRLSADLLQISHSRCDNPFVRVRLFDNSATEPVRVLTSTISSVPPPPLFFLRKDLLNDESLELSGGDEFSPPGSSLSPRPTSLAISPRVHFSSIIVEALNLLFN